MKPRKRRLNRGRRITGPLFDEEALQQEVDGPLRPEMLGIVADKAQDFMIRVLSPEDAADKALEAYQREYVLRLSPMQLQSYKAAVVAMVCERTEVLQSERQSAA